MSHLPSHRALIRRDEGRPDHDRSSGMHAVRRIPSAGPRVVLAGRFDAAHAPRYAVEEVSADDLAAADHADLCRAKTRTLL